MDTLRKFQSRRRQTGIAPAFRRGGMNAKAFLKAGHWPTLFGSFLYFDISFMAWVMLGALGNYIAGEFGLTPAQKGFMTAIPLLGGAVLRLLLGYLTDRIGPKRTGCLGITLTALPLLIGWLGADSMAQIHLIGILLGVAGASFAVALPMASQWYPPQYQGLAMGIAGAGNSGTLLATLFGPRLAEMYGWRGVFGLALIPLAIMFLVFLFCTREAPHARRQPKTLRDFLQVLSQRDTALFCYFYSITFGGFVGLASYLSIYLHDRYGVSKVLAGDLTSLCVLAGSFLRPVGGTLSDRFGGIRMLSLLYLGIVSCLLLSAWAPTVALGTTFLVLTMACLGMGNGAVFQLVPHRYKGNIGAATGILGAAGGFGGFILSNMMGSLREMFAAHGAGLVGFAILAGGALLALRVIQGKWVGRWIAAHGRPLPETAAAPAAAAAPLTEPALVATR